MMLRRKSPAHQDWPRLAATIKTITNSILAGGMLSAILIYKRHVNQVLITSFKLITSAVRLN